METTSTKHLLERPIFYTVCVIAIFIIRIFIIIELPLMDKTEARYAEIARLMAETNNYISLQIDYGTPFWAKPPLSTWMSALSIEALGLSEFSVRLPSLVLGVFILILIGKYAKRQNLPFFLPALILLTIPEFLLHIGVVSTDVPLAFCVALTMLSFWESMSSEKPTLWNYLFFVAIGLGLLAKGPIILLLTVPPLFVWVVAMQQLEKVIKTFPWILGFLLIGILSIPWYYFAEKATPGFLDYFIVGEHFKRFFDSGWSGDKYGFPKSQPIGMIWVFLIVFTLPWIVLVVNKIWKKRWQIRNDPWLLFLTLWILWTPIFFTFSSSLIHPYIMPVIVPLALLITYSWKSIRWKKTYLFIGISIPVISTIFLIIAVITKDLEHYAKTDKYLLETIQQPNRTIYHLNKKSYSGQFYSQGKIVSITKENLDSLLNGSHPLILLISHRDSTLLDNKYHKKMRTDRINKDKGLYTKK